MFLSTRHNLLVPHISLSCHSLLTATPLSSPSPSPCLRHWARSADQHLPQWPPLPRGWTAPGQWRCWRRRIRGKSHLHHITPCHTMSYQFCLTISHQFCLVFQAAKDLDPPGSTLYASQPYNESKNRYINILASEITYIKMGSGLG